MRLTVPAAQMCLARQAMSPARVAFCLGTSIFCGSGSSKTARSRRRSKLDRRATSSETTRMRLLMNDQPVSRDAQLPAKTQASRRYPSRVATRRSNRRSSVSLLQPPLARTSGSFTRPTRSSSRQFPIAIGALTKEGSCTPIVVGCIKRTSRLIASRGEKSSRRGTTRAFVRSRLRRFSTTWLRSRHIDRQYRILCGCPVVDDHWSVQHHAATARDPRCSRRPLSGAVMRQLAN